MGLVELIVIIAVVGLFVWAITTLVPMPDQFRTAIYVISVVALCLYLLSALGFMPHFHDVRIGR